MAVETRGRQDGVSRIILLINSTLIAVEVSLHPGVISDAPFTFCGMVQRDVNRHVQVEKTFLIKEKDYTSSLFETDYKRRI